MLDKQELIASLKHEAHVVKYLAAKVPAGSLDWRPSPKQRSVLELLQYLTSGPLRSAITLVNGNRDHMPAHIEAAAKVTAEGFAAAMDRQIVQLEKLVLELPEDYASRKVQLPWGAEVNLRRGLVDTSLKFMTAYRMQLFLYLKHLGVDLNTRQCWAGVDSYPSA